MKPITLRKSVQFPMLLAAALGYLGAAVFYSYLFGLQHPDWAYYPVGLWCLPCANMDFLGWEETLLRGILILGSLNALLFVILAWVITNLLTLFRKTNRS